MKQALVIFVLLAIACLGLGFQLGSLWYRKELRARDERLKARDEEIQRLQSQIRDLHPVDTAYSRLTNEELQRKALELVARMHSRHEAFYELERIIEREDADGMREAHDGAARGMHLRESERQKTIRMKQVSTEYQTQFKVDATLLRDELILRLPTMPPGGIWGAGRTYVVPDFPIYDGFNYPTGLRVVASNLEGLAKCLPINLPPPSESKRSSATQSG